MKSTIKKTIVRFALWLLRKAGNGPERYETPEQVVTRRKSYLPELEDAGYNVERLTPYQYRINGVLDIYPTNARFHDIKRNKRGSFGGQNLARFVRQYLGEF